MKRAADAAGPDAKGARHYAAAQEHAPAAAGAAAAEVEAAFAKVRKNRVAGVSQLCQLAQRIERLWDADAALRRELLGAFSRCLASLEGHKDQVCRELSSLAPKVSPDSTLRHFLTIALPVERQHTRGLRDHEFLVLRPDDLGKAAAAAAAPAADAPAAPAEGAAAQRRMPLTLVLDNLRSAFNVGSIFRTAECLRLQQLLLCGYTAAPGDSKGQTGRASMGADEYVPHRHYKQAADAVAELRQGGVAVYALETVEGAPSLHEFSFPSPCALVLGNERHGIEADLLARCDGCIRIPCHGVKNSLNVGVAAAITAYELARQWKWDGGAGPPPAAAPGRAAGAVDSAEARPDAPGP